MRKLLVAILKLTGKRLQLLVNNLVCADIASLGESLAANVAAVRLLTGMPTLMCLMKVIAIRS